MLKINQMEIFFYVATCHSFSKAAVEMGVSKSFISEQISLLEKQLQLKLLYRTTRYLRLTQAGEIFFESCAKIIAEKQLAISLLKNIDKETTGQLKISAPPSMCDTFLSELIPVFSKKHPDILLTLDSSASIKHLLHDDIDIALRITKIPDEKYIARVIKKFRFVICATQKYLKHHQKINTPYDLTDHNCLIYSLDPAGNRWPLEINAKEVFITVKGNVITNHSALVKKMLLADQGIARLPEYLLRKEISDKKIKVLFSEYKTIETPIYAIYQSHIKTPKKIKMFLESMKDHLVT